MFNKKYKFTEEWFDPKIKPYIESYIDLADQWTGNNSFKHLIRDSAVENIVKGGLNQKIVEPPLFRESPDFFEQVIAQGAADAAV